MDALLIDGFQTEKRMFLSYEFKIRSLETHFFMDSFLLSHDLFPSQKERVKALFLLVSSFSNCALPLYAKSRKSPLLFSIFPFPQGDTTNKYNRGGTKVWMKKQEKYLW